MNISDVFKLWSTSSSNDVPTSSSSSAQESTEEYRKTYEKWFNHADSDGDGRLTGTAATHFFRMSKLSQSDLNQIWALADSKTKGFLGLEEFVNAMQLISLAQDGKKLTPDILGTTADSLNLRQPPLMEGLDAWLNKVPEIDGSNAEPQAPQSWHNLFISKPAKKTTPSHVTSIYDGLESLYFEKLQPLEVAYQFSDFGSPLLRKGEFNAKPMIMLLGQYSTGKTTFINHLLKCNYPGARIGPEPTTDRFVAVMSGPDKRTIPGHVVAYQANLPFKGLSTFGPGFLSKFECSQMPHPLLEQITIVDTPGVLTAEKHGMQHGYDFTGVISWFASKCDLILLVFDPNKLDISDEFKRVLKAVRGHGDKIRVVFNKADQVESQHLLRLYGALLWSLRMCLNTPELVRVYIGSFNDKQATKVIGPIGTLLFEAEQDALLADLVEIPKRACDRRINEFVKRARCAIVHALIIGAIKKEMPVIVGKSKAEQRLIDNLEDLFAKVKNQHRISADELPDVEQFKEVLLSKSFEKFEKLKPKLIQAVEELIDDDIPGLLKKFRSPFDES